MMEKMSSSNIKIEEGAGRAQRALARERKQLEAAKKMERQSSDINECAEAFIQRFRQQLRIQRLESLENYERMLTRGT